jgi:wyosine [tRNA(Phe)-imidazoG37] synthetase (radical SAM superfamily)
MCTYDCVYCQLGPTTVKTIDRRPYGAVDDMVEELQRRLDTCPAPPDYIGIAGSGEPTLNSQVGLLIDKVKAVTSIPVAVLTNASALDAGSQADPCGRTWGAALAGLGDDRAFQRVNRPHTRPLVRR